MRQAGFIFIILLCIVAAGLALARRRAAMRAFNSDVAASTASHGSDGSVASSGVSTNDGGSLKVDSEPPGASILINGCLVGATPLTLAGLSSGLYDLRLEKEGCVPVSRGVALNSTGVSVKERMPPLPVGTLSVDLRPEGAEVLLDDELVGHTPLQLGQVAAGAHRLLIRKTNFEAYSKRIDIPPGGQAAFSGFELKDKILEMLNDQVKTSPQRVGHYLDLGHYLFINDRMDEAVEAYVKGMDVRRTPLDFDGPGYAGKENTSKQEITMEQRLRHEDEARFDKELEKHRNWKLKDTRAFCLKLEEAQEAMNRKALVSWPRTDMSAKEQIKDHNYERAARIYRDFITTAPPEKNDVSAQAYLALMEVYCMTPNAMKAAELFDNFYELYLQDGAFLQKCGSMIYPYYERFRSSRERQQILGIAEKALRRSLELLPHGEANALAHFDLGSVLIYQNRASSAVPELQKAVENTENPALREDRSLRLADALRKAGKLAAARDIFNKLKRSERASVRESAKNGLIFVGADDQQKKER